MPTIPMSPDVRYLTTGERNILFPIFWFTIPYDEIWIGHNAMCWGGCDNSITPGTVPMLAKSVWKRDFTGADFADQWNFVHEMTHVWQSYHGNHNHLSALRLYLKYGNGYDPDAYRYNLDDGDRLADYNMEQQASIVADYWAVGENNSPKYNTGTRKDAEAYEPFIWQLRAAAPPRELGNYARRADSRPL